MSSATQNPVEARQGNPDVDNLTAVDGAAALTGGLCRLNADTKAGEDATGEKVVVRAGTRVVMLSTVTAKDGVPVTVNVRAQDGASAGLGFEAKYSDLERFSF